jgi:NAD(P)-dependent dehydrogenase (short-subunit alcohol dehydrogenase family)
MKTILITGATDGLGRAVAFELTSQDHELILHGRNPQKGEKLLKELAAATDNRNKKLTYYNADFSEMAQIKKMANEILTQHQHLDVLINNAGLGAEKKRSESKDRVERIFQVNYLATYMLSKLLLPLLIRSAPSRIVNVASAGQTPIDYADPMLKKSYDGMRAYCQAKLAQISLTMEMAPELKDNGVTVNALHPATYLPTKIVPYPISRMEIGVRSVCKLAIDEEMAEITGKYFFETREDRALEQAYDTGERKKLMELSVQLTGIH